MVQVLWIVVDGSSNGHTWSHHGTSDSTARCPPKRTTTNRHAGTIHRCSQQPTRGHHTNIHHVSKHVATHALQWLSREQERGSDTMHLEDVTLSERRQAQATPCVIPPQEVSRRRQPLPPPFGSATTRGSKTHSQHLGPPRERDKDSGFHGRHGHHRESKQAHCEDAAPNTRRTPGACAGTRVCPRPRSQAGAAATLQGLEAVRGCFTA
ncbi:uncharacterized protein LOC118150086 [Callithrix jacchus]